MRRALDRAAVESIGGADKCGSQQGSPKLRKTVCFTDCKDDVVMYRIEEEKTLEPLPQDKTPPRRGKDLQRATDEKTLRSQRAEDEVRRNLSRLVANHRRVADSWSWTPVCECHRSFSVTRAVKSCLPADTCALQRHAAIDGDVMFIGSQPGVAEDALMLTGVEVSVDGATVAILSEGMPTTLQTLSSQTEAELWAAKVRAASDLWQQLEKLTEAALHAQRQAQMVRSDTGGTLEDDEDDQSSKVDVGRQFLPKECESRPWVQLTSRSVGNTSTPDSDESSNWRTWMRSLFQGAPSIVVA